MSVKKLYPTQTNSYPEKKSVSPWENSLRSRRFARHNARIPGALGARVLPLHTQPHLWRDDVGSTEVEKY